MLHDISIFQSSFDQSLTVTTCGEALASEELEVETLEQILACKPVREKRIELEKKVESLRKKHEKERARAAHLQQKSCDFGGSDSTARRTKFYMTNKLVKRLSSKNMYVIII